MKRSPTLAATLAASLLLFIAACGDDGSDDADDATTTTTETAGDDATTTTTAADGQAEGDDATSTSTTAVDGEGISRLEELAAGLLITLDELGDPKLIDAGYTPLDGPNACGYDLDAEFPSEVLVGATFGDNGHVFQQEIRVFADAETALAAFEAGVAGTTCDDAADGSVFAEPIDVTDDVGAETAVLITAESETVHAVLIAAVVRDALVAFQFGSFAGAPETLVPVDVAAFGIGKILAALEEG